MREDFSTIQIRLGRQYKRDVPNMDVENRWNSMFDMVNKCYELRDVFESLCNLDEFKNRLNYVRLNDENWRELKSVIDVLEVMANIHLQHPGRRTPRCPCSHRSTIHWYLIVMTPSTAPLKADSKRLHAKLQRSAFLRK
jgi:hypothetical protein